MISGEKRGLLQRRRVGGAYAASVPIDSNLYIIVIQLHVYLWSDVHEKAHSVESHLVTKNTTSLINCLEAAKSILWNGIISH